MSSARRALGLGWTTGAVYFGGTLYWVVGVMQTFGGLPLVIAIAVAALLASYLAIYTALFAWLVRRAVLRFGVAGLWLTPLFWVATEWLRSTVGGGFPWVLLGTSQATVLPVVQLGSVAGVYGLSAFVALVATAAAVVTLARTRFQWGATVVVAVLVVTVVAMGARRVATNELTRAGTPLRVGLVQGAVAQEQKYDPRFRDAIIARYLNLSRQVIAEGAELVIWPEAATPFYLDMNAALAAPIRRLAAETRTPFIIGTDDFAPGGPEGEDRYYNAAVLVGPDGQSMRTYRKMQLVPFGEYVPLKSLLFFIGPLVEAVSDFSAGTEPVVFDVGGRRLSVAICYESVYPWLARTFVTNGSQLLVTITNDAWFGLSSAAYQHFEQGALRGVEEGRYVVRAANTGISGSVDPYGRVVARTGLFRPEAVTVDVRLQDHRTIYNRTGDVVVWLGLASVVGMMAVGRRGREVNPAEGHHA